VSITIIFIGVFVVGVGDDVGYGVVRQKMHQ
jgi:hypothetical protein